MFKLASLKNSANDKLLCRDAAVTRQLYWASYMLASGSQFEITEGLSWFFVQINILEGRAGYVVLMDRVSVTISYSFRCLTTETVKYTNENCFIENLA